MPKFPSKRPERPEVEVVDVPANVTSRHGSVRGVPYAVDGDSALTGDTRAALHHRPLPRRTGPNFTDEQTTLTGPGRRFAAEGSDETEVS